MLSEKIFRPGQSRCSLILTEHHEEKRAHESIEHSEDMVTRIISYLCFLSLMVGHRINSYWRENNNRNRKMPDAFTVAIILSIQYFC